MKVLIIGKKERYEKYCPDTEFARSAEKINVDLKTPVEEMLAAASDADFIAADAIAKVPAELIQKMPALKVIHSEGVAYNGIDLKAAAERGVYVCNNKGINASAVAEQTILLMLGLLRNVVPCDRDVREGRQIQTKERMMVEGITEFEDCRVGLIGFGDIAKALAVRLRPFGCEVYYHATSRKSPDLEAEYGVSWLELPELISSCDMVSIHVPVTPDTEKMVDEDFLKRMKKTAYLINTSRGELVDNEALCKALSEGWIAGAGLDTVAPEPVQPDHPLVTLPEGVREKILFSPHIAGITTNTFKKAHRNIWKAFEDAASGRRPRNVVSDGR